ncbi:histidinol-phosphate transaminase [Lysobacter olei]
MNAAVDTVTPARSAHDEAWYSARASRGVHALKAYDPGHDLVALRRQFGVAQLVELGSNENSYGPSPAARGAVLDCLHALHRYPDPTGADLKRALARVHGVGENELLLGNGSHELLMMIAQVFAGPGSEVVYPRYGFAVFALATQAAGATARVAEARPRTDTMPAGHDLDTLLAAITPATSLLYLANPNNPTGTWLGAEALRAFLARVPDHVIVVIDEAYAELADASDYRSGLALRDAHPNLVVSRTFSKAYGLAGLRAGYFVAPAGLVAVMERVRESFNVNLPALAACEAALGDVEHLDWVRARNREERAALTEALQARALRVFPSQTNFVLVEFGERTASVERALVERGVILRPMGGYGLGDCLRITVGTRDENRRLLAALDEVLA